MSTRSSIAIREADGTITAIYCHSDGYVQHNGRILLLHYFDEKKVRELIALGGLSCLKPLIGEKHPHRAVDTPCICDECRAVHNWSCTHRPCTGWTVSYKRDREEATAVVEQCKTVKEWRKKFDWCEYFYLFEEGGWRLVLGNGQRRELGPYVVKDAKEYAKQHPEEWGQPMQMAVEAAMQRAHKELPALVLAAREAGAAFI